MSKKCLSECGELNYATTVKGGRMFAQYNRNLKNLFESKCIVGDSNSVAAIFTRRSQIAKQDIDYETFLNELSLCPYISSFPLCYVFENKLVPESGIWMEFGVCTVNAIWNITVVPRELVQNLFFFGDIFYWCVVRSRFYWRKDPC